MLWAFARRLAVATVNVSVILIIAFILESVLPSDPARVKLGIRYTEQSAQVIRAEYGLDQPVLKQFAVYVTKVLKGDFGRSSLTGEPIGPGFLQRGKASLLLVLTALACVLPWVAWAFATAVSDSSGTDLVESILLTVAVIPTFVVSVLAILLVGNFFHTSLLPLQTDAILPSHLIAPAVVLSFHPSLILYRVTRNSLAKALTEKFVVAKIAFGFSQRRVMVSTALRSAGVSILANATNLVGFFLASLYIVESVFGLGGVGSWTVSAALNYDIPVVLANVLFAAILLNGTSIFAHVGAVLLDPRVSRDLS